MRSITLPANHKRSLPLRVALYLTLARIFISPVLLILYLYHQNLGLSLQLLPYVMLSVLTLSELSDVFDGYVARRFDQVTDLGKILDPMADSIARISLFLTFTQGVIALPLLLVLVFLYRDVIISMLRTLCALRGVALAARTSGKIKAVVQAVASYFVIMMMIPYSLGKITLIQFQNISLITVGFAALYTLVSGIEYIFANLMYIKLAWSKK